MGDDFMEKKDFKKDGLFIKIIELMAYEIILFFSYYLSLHLDLFGGYDARNFQAFCETIPWLLGLAFFVFLFLGVLNTVNKSKSENVAIISISVMILTVLYMALAFFFRGFAIPRTVIFLAALLQFIGFIGVKSIFLFLIRRKRGIRLVMIVGYYKDKEELVSKILPARSSKDQLRYFIEPHDKTVLKYIDSVDKIYLSDAVDNNIKDRIITHCISMDKSLYIIPKTFEIAIFNSKLIQMSDIPMFRIDSLYLSKEQMIIKRLFDLLVSVPMLIIFSPFMILTALAILLTDGRPVLYKQERVTINNKRFMLYKFRSMRKDAEKRTGAVWAAENDPRVTGLGKFLRKYWLDELPQLFNVIKGDMSMVGPRPERIFFINQFSKDIPDFNYRLSVKAGVTGLAQVLGKYATSPENKIKFDLLYIKNANLLFDIKIMFDTFKKIIMGTLKRGENMDLSYEELLKRHKIVEKPKDKLIEYWRI